MSKKTVEQIISYLKLLFYFSFLLGVLWSTAYYWFVVGILPDFEYGSILGYIFTILIVGLVFSLLFIAFTISGGWILRYFYEKEKENAYFKWLYLKKYKGLKNLHILFLIPAILFSLIFITDNLIGFPIPFIVFLQLSTSFILLPTIIWISFFGPRIEAFSYGFMSVVLYILSLDFWIIMIRVGAAEDLFIVYLVMAMVTLSLLNILLFDTTSQSKVDRNISLILMLFALIFVVSSLYEGKSIQKFLSLPFNKLKIGQIEAVLTLDKKYIEETQLLNYDIKPLDPGSHSFRFFIHSSIGNEFILEGQSIETHKEPSESKRKIIKIPKKYVLKVEYL